MAVGGCEVWVCEDGFGVKLIPDTVSVPSNSQLGKGALWVDGTPPG